ncbi:hypothetical protein JG687_00011820 [Phytophthora cactorum]|uniref:Uncharacterized protein n=1 Tax=Phytophthora cactorum TaxID=29920 RepID=A0A8T1U3J7_9STRA|nr:hypothetical protein JG687_00011820 [Phytophthora cactorum]
MYQACKIVSRIQAPERIAVKHSLLFLTNQDVAGCRLPPSSDRRCKSEGNLAYYHRVYSVTANVSAPTVPFEMPPSLGRYTTFFTFFNLCHFNSATFPKVRMLLKGIYRLDPMT